MKSKIFFWEILSKFSIFHRLTCTTCHALFPKIEKIFRKNPHTDLCQANISIVPSVGAKFHVFSAPTILIFHNNKEYARFDCYTRLEIFEEKIGQLKTLTEENFDIF